MARKRRNLRRAAQARRSGDLLLLDEFSGADLKHWRAISQSEQRFQNDLFYALESQRATHHEALCDALQSVEAVTLALEPAWTRMLRYRYSLQPLSARGSLNRGGRFNIGNDIDPSRFPAFPALYVAEDYETAFREFFQLPQATRSAKGLRPEEIGMAIGSFLTVDVVGEIHRVFELTRRNLRPFCDIIRRFKIPRELLAQSKKRGRNIRQIRSPADFMKIVMHKEWRAWPEVFDIPANSQIFGRLLRDAGFVGVLYSSSKSAGNCLAIFVENIADGDSWLVLKDVHPNEVQHPRLDTDTWHELI